MRLINHLLWTFPDPEDAWGIIQKQTGADRLTIGGALSANIHGRGLRLQPFVADVESFTVVDAHGELHQLQPHRQSPPVRARRGRLRHVRRRSRPSPCDWRGGSKVERRVSIVDIDDLPALFELRVREGYEFGDCQFATDPASREFLRAGVFSCYRPVAIDVPIPDGQRSLAPHEWRRLLRLAHTSKSQAFAEYARYYMATDGQLYWSDTHQLSDYPDGYHADLDRELGAAVKGSEMITELYVPRPALPEFMRSVRADARQHGTDIIYGTIRIIEEDDQTVLAWARQRWACIVFNLHVDHSPEGIATAAGHFRRLIDRAIELGGSYYLTYHRWASAEQALACHPRLPRVHRRETPDRSRRRVLERLVHPSRTTSRERIMKPYHRHSPLCSCSPRHRWPRRRCRRRAVRSDRSRAAPERWLAGYTARSKRRPTPRSSSGPPPAPAFTRRAAMWSR